MITYIPYAIYHAVTKTVIILSERNQLVSIGFEALLNGNLGFPFFGLYGACSDKSRKKRLLVDASLGLDKKHLKLDLKRFLVGTSARHRKSKRNAFLWTPYMDQTKDTSNWI